MHKFFKSKKNYCNYYLVLIYSYLIIIALIPNAIAKPSDPLTFDRQDPLIPQGYGRRELSSFEKYRLAREMIKLDDMAQAELAQGNEALAMQLWYRQLRLSRAIDLKTEIETLGKVGTVAWSENLGDDVRNIADRLIVIQTEADDQDNFTAELLATLARAYESIKYLDKAIEINQQILTNNQASRLETLKKLGELYLAIFDYDNAAIIYQEIQEQDDILPQQQVKIWQTLAKIYDQNGKANQSIAIKKKLINYYWQAQQYKPIASLEIAIAHDYRSLKQMDQAIAAYEQAFDTAISNQQLAIASNSLLALSKIYQQQGNWNQAIKTSQKLLSMQQQAYDFYGLVNTYNALGNIYLNLNQTQAAKQSFQQALTIAKEIDYQVKKIQDQIKKL